MQQRQQRFNPRPIPLQQMQGQAQNESSWANQPSSSQSHEQLQKTSMLYGQADSEAQNPSSSTPESTRPKMYSFSLLSTSKGQGDDEEIPGNGAAGLRRPSPPSTESLLSRPTVSGDAYAATDIAEKQEKDTGMPPFDFFQMQGTDRLNAFDFNALQSDEDEKWNTRQSLQQNVEDRKEESKSKISSLRSTRQKSKATQERSHRLRTMFQTSSSDYARRKKTSSPKGWREWTVDTLLMEWTTVNPAELPLASPTH